MSEQLDLDAIRERMGRLEALADQEATGLRGGPYATAVALAAVLVADDVPALLAEVRRLRDATLPITCTLCGCPVQGVRCTPSCEPKIVTPSVTGEVSA